MAHTSDLPATPLPKAEPLPSMILILSGQSIHIESPNSPAVYVLDRGVAKLTHSTSRVTLERVNIDVRSGADTPAKSRSHHIYDLRHYETAPGGLASLPSYSPHYYIQKTSNKALGSFGIKKSRFRSQWKALPLDVSGKNTDYGLSKYLNDGAAVFQFAKKEHTYEWMDENGNSVAVEDTAEHCPQLLVTAELQRDVLDALVGLWCCRLWQQSADNTEPVNGGKMEEGE